MKPDTIDYNKLSNKLADSILDAQDKRSVRLGLLERRLFSIYDAKSNIYGDPFSARNADEARRMFCTLVSGPSDGNLIAMYPEDFSLYQIGSFYPENGDIESSDKVLLEHATAYVKKDNN